MKYRKLNKLSQLSITIVSVSLLTVSSCKQSADTSYEREAIKLKAERELLNAQLKTKEEKISSQRTELTQLRAQLTEAENNSEPEQPKNVNAKQVRLGLMEAVDELQKKIESEKQNLHVKNYALDQLDINTEFPFTGIVSMNIQSRTTGAVLKHYWQAKGNFSGQWVLSNTDKPITKEDVATAKPSQKPNSPTHKSVKNKQKSSNSARAPRDPNTHIIDWSKIE